MKWIRSWPSPTEMAEKKLENVPHVVDTIERMFMTDYNYMRCEWPLDEVPGFCMLEWDIALDPLSRQAFAAEALLEPREILVAPYRFHDTWCMWIGSDGSGPSTNGRPVKLGETRCDSFGLVCIYIPTVILKEFLAVMNKFGFTDATFGKWYYEKYGQARMTWNVHPQHLHEYPDVI